MATKKALNCCPCDYKHETKTAVKWCTDCAEALCLTCFEAHKSFKVSRNHNVISIEDHNALQGIISNLSEVQRCDQHDKRFEYFCPLHDEVVCIKCIQTKHSECTGWLPISEAADGVKASVAKETIKQDLEDMIRNIEELIDSHKKEQLSNQNVCKSLKDEASKVAQSIIQKVKDLEAELYKTIDVQHHDISGNVGNRAIQLQDQLQKIKELRDRLNSIEGYASDTQIFLGIRKISKELGDSIEETKSVTKEPIIVLKKLQITAPVQSFLSEVTLLGHVQNNPKHILFQPTKLQKVQSNVSVTVSKSIKDIEVQKIVNINVSKPESKRMRIWSAVVLPLNQFIFDWDESKSLVIYNSDGEFVKNHTLEDNVRYMTMVDLERLAFSYERSKEVGIYNMRTLKMEKRIPFKENCYGLSYDGRILYVVGATTIFCVELADNLMCISSVPVNTDNVAFLSVHGDRLYYADYKKHTVYCSEKNGKEIWSFKNKIMNYPIGITSDHYGNAYVTCTKSHNVLVISADGNHYKELLDAFNGLVNPRAIIYDKSDSRLLVCNNANGQALLCTMK
ncbi:unnamed protein product [Mytilus coruscus]|uniref:B box-type domain-containing protein n=1 Tax=Mytilus coruscus TaxID=42192 RepID=A0A6J8CYT0_MYTCO|nr:unnamed protein product [Mytilus coruscus]